MTLYSAGPFKTVCVFDPAIDRDKTSMRDLQDFARTRDLSKVQYKMGEAPTVFWVRRLPESIVMALITQAVNEQHQAMLAFASGVVRVENMRAEDGSCVTFVPEWQAQGKSHEVMTEAELSRFPIDERLEIGGVAWGRAFLRPGRPQAFRLPRWSHVGLANLVRSSRYAEQQALQFAKQSEEESASTKATEPSGVELGNATATVSEILESTVPPLSTVTSDS